MMTPETENHDKRLKLSLMTPETNYHDGEDFDNSTTCPSTSRGIEQRVTNTST